MDAPPGAFRVDRGGATRSARGIIKTNSGFITNSDGEAVPHVRPSARAITSVWSSLSLSAFFFPPSLFSTFVSLLYLPSFFFSFSFAPVGRLNGRTTGKKVGRAYIQWRLTIRPVIKESHIQDKFSTAALQKAINACKKFKHVPLLISLSSLFMISLRRPNERAQCKRTLEGERERRTSCARMLAPRPPTDRRGRENGSIFFYRVYEFDNGFYLRLRRAGQIVRLPRASSFEM